MSLYSENISVNVSKECKNLLDQLVEQLVDGGEDPDDVSRSGLIREMINEGLSKRGYRRNVIVSDGQQHEIFEKNDRGW